MSKTAYFYLTPEGQKLAQSLSASHPGDIYGKENFKETLRKAFESYDYLVCIMATGIVVRILAPCISHKTSDPGVVVMDQKGRFAISLLSGHLGGANDLARKMAFLSGGEAVITTATDVAGELSFDSFAKKYHMSIENIGVLKSISGTLLEGKPIVVVSSMPSSEPTYPELWRGKKRGRFILCTPEEYSSLLEKGSQVIHIPTVVIHEGFTLSEEEKACVQAPVLYLRPRTICAGIGCKRGMESAPIEAALMDTLKKEGLSPLSLKSISTIPLKADEPGILALADKLQVPLTVIPTEDIESLDIQGLGIAASDYVEKQTGVLSVSTASSYLASDRGIILVDKAKYKGITIALSKAKTF